MVRKVEPKLQMIFDQMPGAWGCKDENSNFMYANREYAQIVGLQHHLDAIGMSDSDMPCETANCANLFRSQDIEVMQTGRRIRILDIHPFVGREWKAYIFTKTPLLDENMNTIGTIFHGMDITNTTAVEVGSMLAGISRHESGNNSAGQTSYTLGTKFGSISLTPRQSECLFFLLRGKTLKQIASILVLSERTIQEYLEILKQKFSAQNRYELIDKAIELGYLNLIPESLFNRQLSLKLRE